MAEQRFGGDVRIYGAGYVETQGTGDKAIVARLLLQDRITFVANRANHTGTQLFDTISDGKSYVDGRIQAIVGAAPAALDTLEEIAAALAAGDTEVAALTNTVAGIRTDLTTLQGRVTDNESNIASLRSDLTALQGGSSGSLATLRSDLDALTTRVTATETVANAAATQTALAAETTARTAADNALDARIDALEVPTVYKATVGNGSLSVIPVTHNLNSSDVELIVRDTTDGQRIFPVDIVTGPNAVNLDFGSFVPAANSIRVVVKAY